MKPKKPIRSEPAFIEFANLPGVSDGFKDDIFYDILVSSHRNLRKLLDQIIRDQQVSMTKELKYFTDEGIPYKPKYVVENGKLDLTLKYDPEELLIPSPNEPKWFPEIKRGLLSFLIDPKMDERKIKKCPFCNNYYTADDIRRFARCYSDDCEKAYRRNKKRRQREEDPARYF